MKRHTIENPTWLDLSQAAEYLGVHFTTLRRWADAGEVAFIRTPGGRRRFTLAALDAFLRQVGQGAANEAAGAAGQPAAVTQPAAIAQPAADNLPPPAEPSETQPAAMNQPAGSTPPREQAPGPLLEAKAIQNARQSVLSLSAAGNWLERMSPEQRQRLKGTGHRLMALLLQYNGRSEGGEVYLEEGQRITSEYSQVCASIGLSLVETVNIFLFFRRSILDAVHETGYLGGDHSHKPDFEGQQLYLRTTTYLDRLLLELIGSYLRTQA